jgi:putative nucleotidyltransferase with HDIG domain
MKFPSKEEAENILLWGHNKNPGPWLNHSKSVARTAEKIALKCNLDENKAYILGLLHDIGRHIGITGLKHVLDGYNLMNEKGYVDNAKICLTHSFPNKDINSIFGEIDCTEEEFNEINSAIINYEYNDYDKLIQLCDSLCMAEGVCLLEVRLIDVARRYNTCNQNILEKWNAYFDIKTYFDIKCGINIYELFYEEITKNSIK